MKYLSHAKNVVEKSDELNFFGKDHIVTIQKYGKWVFSQWLLTLWWRADANSPFQPKPGHVYVYRQKKRAYEAFETWKNYLDN